MWMFTTHGFISVTQYPGDRRKLQVRARTLKHIEAIREEMCRACDADELDHDKDQWPIITTRLADYRYRFLCTSLEWSLLAGRLCNAIDYDNFKIAAYSKTGDEQYAKALHKAWEHMEQLQIRALKKSPR